MEIRHIVIMLLLLGGANATLQLTTSGVSILETPTSVMSLANYSALINITSNESPSAFVWSWNGVNYSIYDKSLVLMYNFDNAFPYDTVLTAHDESFYGNNGSIHGAYYASGEYGDAMEFNGSSGNYIDAGHDPSLDLTSDYTLEAWVYLDQDAPSGTGSLIISKAQWGGYTGGYDFGVSSDYGSGGLNSLYLINQDSNGQEIYRSNIGLNVSGWHFVVATFSDNQPTIYIDGVDTGGSFDPSYNPGTTTMRDAGINQNDLFIGNDNVEPYYGFPGKIDEVRIYNRSLSPDEISQDYYSSLSNDSGQWFFSANEPLQTTDDVPYQACATGESGSQSCTAPSTISPFQQNGSLVLWSIIIASIIILIAAVAMIIFIMRGSAGK